MSQPSRSSPKWLWSATIKKHYYIDEATNELVTEDGVRRPNPTPTNMPRAVQAEANQASGVERGTTRSTQSGRPIVGAAGTNTEPLYRLDGRPANQLGSSYPGRSGMEASSSRQTTTAQADASRPLNDVATAYKTAGTGSGSKEAAGPTTRPAGMSAESLTPEQLEARRIHAAALAQAQQGKRKVPSGRGSDSEPASSQQQFQDHFAMARQRALQAGRTPDQAEAIAKEYLIKQFGEMALSPKPSIASQGAMSESAATKRPLNQSSNTQPPSQPPPSATRQSFSSPIERTIRELMGRGYSRQDAVRMLEAQLKSKK